MGRGFSQHPSLCAPLLFSHLSCPSPTSCHTPAPSGLHSVPQLCHGFLPLSLGTVCLSCLRHRLSSNHFARLTPTPVSSLTSHISSWQQLFYEPLQYAGPPDRGPPQTSIFPLMMFMTITTTITITDMYQSLYGNPLTQSSPIPSEVGT